MRYTAAFFAIFLLVGLATALAQNPFDGTWRTNMDESKYPQDPFVISLDKGFYECFTCTPSFRVKADGKDQPVRSETIDTISVREIDAHTVAFVTHKNGKLVSEYTRTVSADGNSIVNQTTEHPQTGAQVVTRTITSRRVKPGPVGSHAISGSWQEAKYTASENDLLVTFKASGNQFSMSSPTGVSFTAQFDGKDYPLTGSYYVNSVSLNRTEERTIHVAYKRDGKTAGTSKLTVSTDGRKLTEVWTDSKTGRTVTEVSDKQ